MKKLLLCALFLFLTPVVVQAKTCNGGDLVYSKAYTAGSDCDSGSCGVFCKSKNTMNWWSAWTWCKSQGRELAELAVMCPNMTASECDNLKETGSGYAWSKTANGDYSFAVNLSSGAISNGGRNNGTYAFCE